MTDASAEWLVERGIGETRAVLVDGGQVIAARLHWPGEITAGDVHEAQLVSRRGGTRRGTVRLANGTEALVDHLPRSATEGASGQVVIVRAPIAERGRLKRASARWLEGEPMPDNAAQPGKFLPDAREVRAFEEGAWEEVWQAASSGAVAFPGGDILCSVTPAMTVIDVDGNLPPRALALAAVPAIARALRWFEIGGNIGIDFPTLQAKADRRAVDAALDEALSGWAHEHTAMNGFGLVQIVTRLQGPSLLHRFASSRTALCARYAMRVAERASGAGVTLLTVHPALKARLKPEWTDELRRRTGRDVRIKIDPALALEAPHAQIVSA
ncbi:ribonuclease E/G [Qipengyuania nanhaisediminis]|uniref:ribonuclease E/G n=1 Tax=Qipengyuania nanhaisediminis TaxID=604088 RepID=UPI0038B25410